MPNQTLDRHPQAMKLVRPIDFVFLTSLGVFVGSCIIVKATGGVGPCGPASSWGLIWLIGYPVGALGMVVGLVLSLVSAFKKPHHNDNPDTDSQMNALGIKFNQRGPLDAGRALCLLPWLDCLGASAHGC